MLTAKDLEKYHQAAERILNAMDNSPVPISWHEMDRMALQSVIAKELILIDKRDITKLSTFLKDMVGTGILIPDEELEDYVREAANLPERTEVPDSREKDERREAQRRAPEKTANEPDGPEVDPEENQDAEEAKKRLGR